jgi:phosphoribosylglycinamide formyltransferase-1
MLTELEITSQGELARRNNAMVEEFISEAIQPVSETIDLTRMINGEPGLPMQFRWRSEIVRITQVLSTWRETGPCHHGSGEQYVRKHWFEVSTDSGMKMKIYFERQSRSANNKKRWWLFSTERS